MSAWIVFAFEVSIISAYFFFRLFFRAPLFDGLKRSDILQLSPFAIFKAESIVGFRMPLSIPLMYVG